MKTYRYTSTRICKVIKALDENAALKIAKGWTSPWNAMRKNLEVWDELENCYKLAFAPKAKPLKAFTVIGFYESNNQIFSHHVKAENIMGAFAVVASMDSSAMCIATLKGHVEEGEKLAFVNAELMDAQTILDLPDVFGDEPLLNGLPFSDVTNKSRD